MSPISPALDATYAASGIWPIERNPITDATLTIEPPPLERIRLAARQDSANGAVTLTSSTRANASVLVFRAGAVSPTPALFTSPSRRP